MSLPIDRTVRLSQMDYYTTPQAKHAVVLHHTVGGSARSSIEWWRADPGRVGTAYVIERDGTIYECFPPEMWAIHLYKRAALPKGVSITDAQVMERGSIGIELASEGALEHHDGILWAFGTGTGKKLGKPMDLVNAGRVVKLDTPWRGFTFFDAYEPAQVAACIELVVELCEKFGIPKHLPPPATSVTTDKPTPELWCKASGILHHAMLRPDKTDLHPLFPFGQLAEAL